MSTPNFEIVEFGYRGAAPVRMHRGAERQKEPQLLIGGLLPCCPASGFHDVSSTSGNRKCDEGLQVIWGMPPNKPKAPGSLRTMNLYK